MFRQLRTHTLSWWHNASLPVISNDAGVPKFQEWYYFDQKRWTPFRTNNCAHGAQNCSSGGLNLITWNVDAGSPYPGERISALLRTIVNSPETPDAIFLQEVSKPALQALLENPWIQKQWLSSESDAVNFGKQSFITVTLISKTCLANNHHMSLGPIFRVPLPSRFDRDALCCDIELNDRTSSRSARRRIRLINVHLDSLPINPSRRPQQLSIITSYLQAAGCGLVAGDFNPVLPEDEALVEKNGLVDAWMQLHPTAEGYTWGVDGEKPFPPNRLDKVALYNLVPESMRVLPVEGGFSDHLGLSCVFRWLEHWAEGSIE